MKLKSLCFIFALVLVVGNVSCQNGGELQFPDETDNQFPPEQTELDGVIHGSGDGPGEDATTELTVESTPLPQLENIDVTQSIAGVEHDSSTDSSSNDLPCPKPCVCNTEGDSSNFVVDCSGYALTEFPSPIDPRATTLKLHNNKLTEIPKSISELKNLKVLNANNNLIMDLASGSVSELPELTVLKLGNNRLIDYPKDLKNSISLSKLEELDLGGNDMRTTLSAEAFSNFKALRKITLPDLNTSELILDLCGSLKETLETVCTGSCEAKAFECPDAPQNIEEDLLDATLPGMIPFNTAVLDENVPAEASKTSNKEDSTTQEPDVLKGVESTSVSSDVPANDFSLRNAVNSASDEKVAPSNVIANLPQETSTSETEVKIGAKTADTREGNGGVNKSVIGIVVAGMIVVIAGITIKKNWSSIKKKFSSTPNRAAGERSRPGENGNATAPEEVPLQEISDKSPV